ncbi:hypothetical protein BCR33DRAFT_712832 [Rhizoclosmatium globosum]|uniref:PH domain-containing protein n=1 Tax=Rhizoclosmatium globosum TaxID=329046 RepID=A0A1Y2CUW9_9FUNG|nr:hypothetical protein BCR33DRAFT_712832 [Rhizoclosmatium globosum]|eukprot:ORY50860.1 hypothetical protein BCR33DRAFT_712832 [Rhizoclosmatium globosum]
MNEQSISPPPLPLKKDKEKSAESVASSTASISSVGKKSRAESDLFTTQPVLHRTGWDLYGKVEDQQDSPTRKLAGLKLKYRYPIPADLNINQYSGFIIVRQWSLAASEMKWKKRFVIIKDNKAFLLKTPQDKDATAIIKLDDCLINPTEFGLFSHSFWLTPPPGALNETNDGKEFMWILIAPSEELKLEWIAQFLKAANWREKQITESGKVPMITVLRPESDEERQVSSPSDSNAPSSRASPALRSTKSAPGSRSTSTPQLDTIFPFQTPDLATLTAITDEPAPNGTNFNQKSKLENSEALKLICASNARFFKNGGYKSASTLIRGGHSERRSSGSSSTSSEKQHGKATVPGEHRKKTPQDADGEHFAPPIIRRATSPALKGLPPKVSIVEAESVPIASDKGPSSSPKASSPKGKEPSRRATSPKLGSVSESSEAARRKASY